MYGIKIAKRSNTLRTTVNRISNITFLFVVKQSCLLHTNGHQDIEQELNTNGMPHYHSDHGN